METTISTIQKKNHHERFIAAQNLQKSFIQLQDLNSSLEFSLNSFFKKTISFCNQIYWEVCKERRTLLWTQEHFNSAQKIQWPVKVKNFESLLQEYKNIMQTASDVEIFQTSLHTYYSKYLQRFDIINIFLFSQKTEEVYRIKEILQQIAIIQQNTILTEENNHRLVKQVEREIANFKEQYYILVKYRIECFLESVKSDFQATNFRLNEQITQILKKEVVKENIFSKIISKSFSLYFDPLLQESYIQFPILVKQEDETFRYYCAASLKEHIQNMPWPDTCPFVLWQSAPYMNLNNLFTITPQAISVELFKNNLRCVIERYNDSLSTTPTALSIEMITLALERGLFESDLNALERIEMYQDISTQQWIKVPICFKSKNTKIYYCLSMMKQMLEQYNLEQWLQFFQENMIDVMHYEFSLPDEDYFHNLSQQLLKIYKKRLFYLLNIAKTRFSQYDTNALQPSFLINQALEKGVPTSVFDALKKLYQDPLTEQWIQFPIGFRKSNNTLQYRCVTSLEKELRYGLTDDLFRDFSNRLPHLVTDFKLFEVNHDYCMSLKYYTQTEGTKYAIYKKLQTIKALNRMSPAYHIKMCGLAQQRIVNSPYQDPIQNTWIEVPVCIKSDQGTFYYCVSTIEKRLAECAPGTAFGFCEGKHQVLDASHFSTPEDEYFDTLKDIISEKKLPSRISTHKTLRTIKSLTFRLNTNKFFSSIRSNSTAEPRGNHESFFLNST